MQAGFITRLSNFAKHPFQNDMDIWNWILFTVLLVTVAVFWNRILAHITEA